MKPNEGEDRSRLIFHKTMRATMLMCRFSGLLPVSGMMKRTSTGLRFSWSSPYLILIFLPSALGALSRVILFINDVLKHELTLRRASTTIFSTSTALSIILLLILSTKYKKMMRSIEDIEEMLPPLRDAAKVVRMCNICACFIMVLGTVEHLLFIVYTYQTTLLCFLLPDDSGMYLRSYFISMNAWFYDYVPFDYYSGFVIQFLVAQSTFVWNFTDVLVMGFSIYLIAMFRSFNRTVAQEEAKSIQDPSCRIFPWRALQIHFTRLTHLTRIIDQHANPFVFVSFASNLFFICQQMFYFINKSFRSDLAEGGSCHKGQTADWETTIYLLYSLAFLVMRVMLVSLLAAQVHKISRESMFFVHSLPTSVYNTEMQRFTEQVYHCRVGLSGLNFFFVTRGMILTVAATIVTYELVLLQIQPRTENY